MKHKHSHLLPMRRALLITALVILAIRMSGQPNKRGNASPPNPQPQPPSTVTNSENYDKPHTQAAESDANPPHWYTPLKRPDWWLVIIAFSTGCAIVYQANEMTNATKEMRRNTDLQKAAYRQWLKIENWSATTPGILGETGIGIVFVGFEIRNPTDFPLTVKQIVLKENGAGASPERLEYGANRFIPPDDRYQFQFQVPMQSEAVENYAEGVAKIFITVIGSITFTDVLGDSQSQDIGQYCILSQKGNEFVAHPQVRPPNPLDDQQRES
ncbi:MAG: hypothetical protein ABSG11_19090 [Candidatus Korobacteraceae bacterium]|jgi:hypothetical protein